MSTSDAHRLAAASPPLAPGSWPSPISAADAVRGRRSLTSCAFAGEDVWWAEGRPDEGGRTVVCARAADGSGPVRDLLPAPFNARTRVHEYGGVSFLPVPTDQGHDLVFVHFADQVLYLLSPGGGTPAPLVPSPARAGGLRWADLSVDPHRNRLLAIREIHQGDGTFGTVRRSVVAIPLDGSAAADPAAITELATGADFYAAPRLDPAGGRLLYLSWNHPDMPWDSTALHLMALGADGRAGADRVIAGGAGISVVDPGFLSSGSRAGLVLAICDDEKWWRPTLIDPADGQRRTLSDRDAEFGGPLWTLGQHHWAELPNGSVVVTESGRPANLEPDGTLSVLNESWTECADIAVDGRGRIALVVGGDTVPSRVSVVDADGTATDLRLAAEPEREIAAAYRAPAREIVVGGVHAVVYPPTNPDHRAAPGTAPYLMSVHGGPTSRAGRTFSATTAFFTSRGIGVVALDYGGSTGYGRAYRERLRSRWGVVDVADAARVAAALVADGTAAPGKVAIQGGSAGGWTVLSVLTTPDMPFAAGVSLFGVADARALAADTHDFESRYVDGLLGADPELWFAASPLARAGNLDTPVLLLQGGKDPIVTPDQAEAFRAVCAERGVPHALIVFPQESHGFRSAAALTATLQAELSFLGQILGFDTPGVPRLELVTS